MIDAGMEIWRGAGGEPHGEIEGAELRIVQRTGHGTRVVRVIARLGYVEVQSVRADGTTAMRHILPLDK